MRGVRLALSTLAPRITAKAASVGIAPKNIAVVWTAYDE
jgi:hypothetical protein